MTYRESREDRNKRVAIEASTLLTRVAAGELSGEHLVAEVAAFHDRWESRGVNWTRPGIWLVDTDQWLTANEMAEYMDVSAAQVRRWAYRGHVTPAQSTDGTPLYNVGECISYRARRGVSK